MTKQKNIKALLTGLGAITAISGGSVVAGDWGKSVINDKAPIADAWSICDIFDYNTLYEGDGFVKSIELKGRYHGNLVSQTEDIGLTHNGYHNYEHRRFRLGVAVEFQNDWSFEAVANIADGHGLTRGPFFNDWDTFVLSWAPSKTHYLTIGKEKQRITREYTTSSNSIQTVERSAITSEVAPGKPWGVTYGFEAFDIAHEVGAWVTGVDDDMAWGRTDSRGSFSYRASFDLTEATKFHFDYAYANNSSGAADPRGNAAAHQVSVYEHVAAVGTVSKWDKLTLTTDLIFAANRNRQGGNAVRGDLAIPAGEDTWGLVILPTYDLTDKLQAVFRYSYMDSGREQRPQRYDVRANVENYHTFYAGLAYKVCGNNLKLLAGYEHATGDLFGGNRDIETGTWMLGLRTSW